MQSKNRTKESREAETARRADRDREKANTANDAMVAHNFMTQLSVRLQRENEQSKLELKAANATVDRLQERVHVLEYHIRNTNSASNADFEASMEANNTLTASNERLMTLVHQYERDQVAAACGPRA